nr:hypothetical protein Iba_chr01fCG5410 [Ipomoea batatas]
MGSKQCAEGDVNGEAKKGEKGDNEKDKQGDSSSDDDGKDESTQSVSYGTWAENLKKKAGEDSDLLEVVEEAGEDSHFLASNSSPSVNMSSEAIDAMASCPM